MWHPSSCWNSIIRVPSKIWPGMPSSPAPNDRRSRGLRPLKSSSTACSTSRVPSRPGRKAAIAAVTMRRRRRRWCLRGTRRTRTLSATGKRWAWQSRSLERSLQQLRGAGGRRGRSRTRCRTEPRLLVARRLQTPTPRTSSEDAAPVLLCVAQCSRCACGFAAVL
jgi:hypothetical protein